MTIIVVSLRNGTFKAPQDFTQIYIGRKSSAYTGLPGGRPLGRLGKYWKQIIEMGIND